MNLRSVARALAALWLLVCLLAAHTVAAEMASPASGSEARIKPAPSLLPRTLSARDAALYREIFALGDAGQWDGVDALMAELGNDLLVGHVLAQRYLHPTAYTSRPEELAMWLARYADHPQSGRVRDLIEEKREAERQALLAARRAAERERLAQARAKAGRQALKARGARPTDSQDGARTKKRGGRNVTAPGRPLRRAAWCRARDRRCGRRWPGRARRRRAGGGCAGTGAWRRPPARRRPAAGRTG